MSGIAAAPRASLYGATKFGMRGFALNLREYLRGSGIGVSHITPGMIRQAGMFADSGAAPSAALGTSTPEQVANAVVRAIERNKSEIRVAPLRQQAVTRFGMLAPEIFGRLAGPSAARTMDAMAAGLADKR